MRVSVVISSYNYGRFLKASLESVLTQTYDDFEVIVIDDGSTDNTAEVVRSFLTDHRVHYRYQVNQGQTAAKNAGIRLAKGDFVAFLDADDFWLPQKLERQIPLFDDPRVGVTFTGYSFVDQQGRALASEEITGYLQLRRGQVTRWLAFDNFVPFSASAVRRELLEKHGAFDQSLGMGIDWDIWLRLSCVTHFDFVPERLVAYRVGHGDQMSRNKNGRFAAADLIFQRFLERHPDALSPRDLREVEFYNACSRAAAYRHSDLRHSTNLLWRAWRMKPLSRDPYVGLLRNAQAMLRRAPQAATLA